MANINILPLTNDDALANHYNMFIPTFPGVLDLVGSNLRVTNVTIPEVIVSEYEVHYKTRKFTKPGGKSENPNEFSFTIRIDKPYLVYKGFYEWNQRILNVQTGIKSDDYIGGVSPNRVPIQIAPTDGAGVPYTPGWTFEGCWCKSVPAISFDNTSGEPIVVDITISFETHYFN